jgi:predicted nucleic acid-binding protein
MSVKIFLDTNILIYTLVVESSKKERAIALLSEDIYVSTQVLSEYANVCLKKLKRPIAEVTAFLDYLKERATIIEVNVTLIQHALNLHQQYRYSYYDSLILAAALRADCKVLISEDFQHQQEIEQLMIINPFVKM